MSMARIASALETWQSMGGALGRSETWTTWTCFCGYAWLPQVSDMSMLADVGWKQNLIVLQFERSSVPSWKWTTMGAAQSEPWNEVTLTLPQGYTVWDWLMMLILVRSSRVWTVLVRGLEHCLFFHVLGTIIPTDFHNIFQRGRYTTNQSW